MAIQRTTNTTLAVLALAGSLAGTALSSTAATAIAQPPSTVSLTSGPAFPAQGPADCWGPNGWNPNCWGPGQYGPGQWGPGWMGPPMMGPGAMMGPDYWDY